MRNNYIVKYLAFDVNNQIIKRGAMRCKDKMSAFDAQASLEKHFENKLGGFKKLLVISCKVEQPEDFLSTLLNLMYKK